MVDGFHSLLEDVQARLPEKHDEYENRIKVFPCNVYENKEHGLFTANIDERAQMLHFLLLVLPT